VKNKPYTSDTLAVSRRMVSEGPLREERAVLHDLVWRIRHRAGLLRYLDRRQGEPVAAEVAALRADAQRRAEALPASEAQLRAHYEREIWK